MSKLKENKKLKIIVGDGSVINYKETNKFNEWISTDRASLDIRCKEEVLFIIPKGSVYRLFMNHVFEHINHNDLKTTLININKILEMNGEIFLAVPDYYDTVELNLIVRIMKTEKLLV